MRAERGGGGEGKLIAHLSGGGGGSGERGAGCGRDAQREGASDGGRALSRRGGAGRPGPGHGARGRGGSGRVERAPRA